MLPFSPIGVLHWFLRSPCGKWDLHAYGGFALHNPPNWLSHSEERRVWYGKAADLVVGAAVARSTSAVAAARSKWTSSYSRGEGISPAVISTSPAWLGRLIAQELLLRQAQKILTDHNMSSAVLPPARLVMLRTEGLFFPIGDGGQPIFRNS